MHVASNPMNNLYYLVNTLGLLLIIQLHGTSEQNISVAININLGMNVYLIPKV